MNTKALIFDMDGTLVDSEKMHWLAWNHTLDKYGLEVPPFAQFNSYVGVSDEEMARQFSAAAEYKVAPDSLVTQKCRTYLDLVPQIELLPGVIDTLERWRGRCPMAVASSSPYRELIALLDHHGVRDRFAHVVGGDMVSSKKPDPEIYHRVVSLLGIMPSACIAFEDSQSGIAAAKGAGLIAVAVPQAMSADHDFSSADLIIDSLADFDEQLLRQLLPRAG